MNMSDVTIAEIKKLEDRRFQAMIDSDFETLDKLLGDHLIYTHSTGQSDTRADYIALCQKGVFKYRKIERPIENIQVYGNTAVVTGHMKMDVIVDGKPKLLNSRYTNVWIKGTRGWQMVAWQSTPIPAPAASANCSRAKERHSRSSCLVAGLSARRMLTNPALAGRSDCVRRRVWRLVLFQPRVQAVLRRHAVGST
jgi:ketosteroid isomerase-like protein